MSTGIAWTDETWNPTTGCDRVSPGCDNCYALTLAKRLKAMGQARYQNDGDPRTSGPGFALTLHPDSLDLPLHWQKPRRVFVNSMSDLFHPDVPDEFIGRVFARMATSRAHTFQILTKRPQRMAKWATRVARCEHGWLTHNGDNPSSYGGTGQVIPVADRFERWGPTAEESRQIDGPWPLPNVWLGTSVENQRYADLRIPHLLATPAAVRFLSIEPLLGPVDLMGAVEPDWIGGAAGGSGAPHPLVDWIILGGESGPGARPMQLEWAEHIVDQCQAAGVAVFVKQLGTVTGGKHHHDVDTFPELLRVREYPA